MSLREPPAVHAPDDGAGSVAPIDPVGALIGRGALYTIATALQLSVTLLVLPAVTRLLPAEAYGVIAVAIVVQVVLGLVAAAGLPDTLPRTYFRTADGPLRAASLVALVAGFALAVALLADLTGRWWCDAVLGLDYDGAVRVAVWASIGTAILLTAQSLLRARDHAAAFFATAVVSTVGSQVAAIALVLLWERTAVAYVTGLAAGTALAALLAVGLSGIAFRPLRDRRFIAAMLALSVPVVFNGLSLYVLWAATARCSTASRARSRPAASRSPSSSAG